MGVVGCVFRVFLTCTDWVYPGDETCVALANLR